MINITVHAKCISLNNQPCMARDTLVDLNPDEYNQGLRYCLFTVNLDRCSDIGNTLDDISSRICVPKETDNVNLNVFIW